MDASSRTFTSYDASLDWVWSSKRLHSRGMKCLATTLICNTCDPHCTNTKGMVSKISHGTHLERMAFANLWLLVSQSGFPTHRSEVIPTGIYHRPNGWMGETFPIILLLMLCGTRATFKYESLNSPTRLAHGLRGSLLGAEETMIKPAPQPILLSFESNKKHNPRG